MYPAGPAAPAARGAGSSWTSPACSPSTRRPTYLMNLDDLIESASRSPMALLRARALLASLLNAAPPQRQPSITWRLHRAEELAAGNFPLIWHHVAAGDPA